MCRLTAAFGHEGGCPPPPPPPPPPHPHTHTQVPLSGVRRVATPAHNAFSLQLGNGVVSHPQLAQHFNSVLSHCRWYSLQHTENRLFLSV